MDAESENQNQDESNNDNQDEQENSFENEESEHVQHEKGVDEGNDTIGHEFVKESDESQNV